MTAKEKAIELVYKFDKVVNAYTNETLKQCALIAVDEIIKETGSKYWYDVKLEINKL